MRALRMSSLARSGRWRVARGGLLAALLAAAAPAGAGTPPAGFLETRLVTAGEAPGPTAAAYEPGSGNLWVLEKGDGTAEGQARVRVRDAVSGVVSTALTLDCVDSRGERGLLGLAFSPDYLAAGDAGRHLFLFYTRRIASTGTCALAGESQASRHRVVRFTESALTLSGEQLILDGPDLTGATNHNAGTLRFAPDGTLFISIGDNDTDSTANPLSRDLGDLRGKLLRIAADGSIPPDNPFIGQAGVLPEIWAWGLRNPFRFAIDTATEAPVIGDVGELQWEAIYLGVPGADYGYPCVEGSAPFRDCTPPPAAGSVTAPIFEYSHGAATPPVSGNSVTGGPVYRHDAFPAEYRGAYFFGDYVDGWIRRGRIDPGGQLVEVEMFMPDASGVVDIVVSPAGCLTWVSITGDGVNEVCHVGGGNGQPQAVAAAAPHSGLADLAVQLTGSESSDPDLDPLLYSWQFGDGGASDLADPEHLYTQDGVYEAVLTVDDQQGATNSLDGAPGLRIVVGNRPPAATITAPAGGSTYDAGETVSFAGSAGDPEDGALAAERLSWTIVFYHGTHTHPFLGPITGVAGGDFTVPASGEDSTDVFYRIHLTATDSGAPLGAAAELTASAFVDLAPNLASLTLAADPPGFGLELAYEQQTAIAPTFHESVAGFPRTIAAPTPQTTGGRTFFFDSWSQGGAAEQTLVTPAADTVYTARFAIDCISADHLVLSNDTVDGQESHEACLSITAGTAYEVVAGGDLTLTAGERVALDNGFSVGPGGVLTVVNIPMI